MPDSGHPDAPALPPPVEAIAPAAAPLAERPLDGIGPKGTPAVSALTEPPGPAKPGEPAAKVDPPVRRTEAAPPSVPTPAFGMAPAVPPPTSAYPIDLPAALRLAESVNPVIGEARARVGEALGQQTQARALLFPSLNAGTNYFNHTGAWQRSSGQIIRLHDQSLYFGGGAGAIGANTLGTLASGQASLASVPAVFLLAHLSDAWFAPLAARQRVTATGFDAAATANDVLLGVATDYTELQGAIARLQARGLTEVEAAEVARITAQYARTGEGRQADADRAATDWKLRRSEVRAAEGHVAVDSARLVRRLHLDPSVRVEPQGDALQLYALINPDAPLEDLLRTAIAQRPEIQARSADVGRAEYRLAQERTRPFLPTVALGFSGGAFGGGSNLDPPTMGRFRGRTDFDVVAFWTLRNFGMGDLAAQRRRLAEVGEATSARARALNRVREEVASARADALAKREQIAVALGEVVTAREGFRKDLERIRGAAGPPLEVLDNLRYLARARVALIDAVVGYNQAQFRLFVAMGSPPPLQGPAEPAPSSAATAALAATVTATLAPAGGGVKPAAPAAAGTQPTREPRPAPEARPSVAEIAPRAGSAMPAGPIPAGMAALAKARQGEIAAMGEYERAQARLMESLGDGKAAPDPNVLRKHLMELAEAHRGEVGARLEYDRALWKLLATLGEARPSAGPAAPEEPRPATAERTRAAALEADPPAGDDADQRR